MLGKIANRFCFTVGEEMKKIEIAFLMKQLISTVILSLLSVTAYGAQMYQDVDIAPMINHFRKQIVTLNKAVTTYNWVSHGGPNDFWDIERPQNDPALLKMAQTSAEVFWSNYGSKEGSENMYGSGLYTAVDPVATYEFGGEGWRMTQLQFPVGMHVLDLANSATIDDSDSALMNAAEDVEEKFACPRSAGADPYFTNGGASLDPKCRQLINEVFNKNLKIDAFAYGYNETYFKACEQGVYIGSRAFVITRPDWIRSEYVHYYTASSRLNEPERLRIQTLFLLAGEEGLDKAPLLDLIAKYFDQYPDRELQGSKTVCEGDSCVITVQFCDSKNTCDQVPLPALPRPGGPMITSEEAKRKKLLWEDLVGKPKASTVSTWLKENKFGCSGELPYQVK
jgi:hypothetical protein